MQMAHASSDRREGQGQSADFSVPQIYERPAVIWNLVVKVASRCNIDCSYCYWFRDLSVYKSPKLMSELVLNQLLARVKEHVIRHSPREFFLVLHGGEPLLWGRSNFGLFADGCRLISEETGCHVKVATTTNGVLIDEKWLDCFEENDIGVTVSIDGPEHIHDVNRKTFAGGPTHALVERGIRLLQSRNIPFGVLAVCNPMHDAREYFDYFSSIGVNDYDIMFPDSTFEDKPTSISEFYCTLFDLWRTANQKERVVKIRDVEAMVSGLVGGTSNSDAIGYGPEEICTILTDGSIEPLDVLRIAGASSTKTTYNVFDNAIQDIAEEPRWKAARDASLNLSQKCRKCRYMMPCGGGYLPHRYSNENGYDNPSVYCDDLYSIFGHIENVLQKHVYISRGGGDLVNIADAAAAQPVEALWYSDNDFSSYEEMQALHAPIIELAKLTLTQSGLGAANIIDLGCGNGALLRQLCGTPSSIRGYGVEVNPHKVVRANAVFREPNISVLEGDLYEAGELFLEPSFSLAIVSLQFMLLDKGRLQSFLQERVRAVLLYAYPDVLQSYGPKMDELVARGIELSRGLVQNPSTEHQTFTCIAQFRSTPSAHSLVAAQPIART